MVVIHIAKRQIYKFDHGAIRTHKSLVPKTNALTIRPRDRSLLLSQENLRDNLNHSLNYYIYFDKLKISLSLFANHLVPPINSFVLEAALC